MLLRLGKNSTGSNSISQWKTFRLLNVVLQTGPCPALAPRTTHTHMCILSHARCSIFHPSLLRVGGGCILFSNTCRTKLRWVSGCHPARGIPACLEQNAFPGHTFNPRGWVGHRGRKLNSTLLFFLCTFMSSHSLEPSGKSGL